MTWNLINIQLGFCFFQRKADWKTFFVFQLPNSQVISLSQYHSPNHVLNKQTFQESSKKIIKIGIRIKAPIITHFNMEKSQLETTENIHLNEFHVLETTEVSILIRFQVIN